MVLTTAGEICEYIDNDLTNFIHTIILLIEIAVPILLIIFGMLDFAKGVIAANEDEIKKGQRIFVKRIISAAVVFFIFSITQLVVGIVATDDSEVWSCAAAIMNGTNRQVRSTTYTPSNISKETKDTCCEAAGGKLNASGACTSWNDENGNRHDVNSEAYNQCTQSLEKPKNGENMTWECCTKAGGKINSNGACASWFDTDENGNITTRHSLDTDVYNSCMND